MKSWLSGIIGERDEREIHWNTLNINKVIEKDNEKEPKRGRGTFNIMSRLEQMKIDLKRHILACLFIDSVIDIINTITLITSTLLVKYIIFFFMKVNDRMIT